MEKTAKKRTKRVLMIVLVAAISFLVLLVRAGDRKKPQNPPVQQPRQQPGKPDTGQIVVMP